MKNTILRTALVLAVLATTVTGKTMDKCCCEMKDEKFYCKLTKKTYHQCCCDIK